MMSHSYSTDAQTKSGDLAATIIAASTPEQIATACSAVESFLHKHSPDQSRWFFSITFPTLICKLFGFDSQNANTSWFDLSLNTSDVSTKLFNLLSPTGVLFNSLTSLDRLSLVKYVFPLERLPVWLRFTLHKNSSIAADLCPPLFKGTNRGENHLHLNIFEYYLFWFTYYPVCKLTTSSSGDNHTTTTTNTTVTSRVSKRFRLDNWVFSKPRGNETTDKTTASLYIRLLNAYLCFFVPLNAQSPYRSSLLHYSSSYDTLVLENADFFIHTLIHFWIVDNDFSPLPVKSSGAVLSLRSILAELPPTPGLGEVVNVFIKYLNSSLVPNSVEVGAADMGSIGYWNSCIQRPLYRYILRTFLFFPVETSVKNVSQVFSLWVSYMEPWAVSVDANTDSLKTDSQSHEYSSSWQGFVLSNYLFYTSLVMHFIGFAHKFIHTDPDVIVQMVAKVVNVLTSSRELVDLLKNVDTVFHSVPAGSSKSMLNSLYRFVPSIREQLQDWEDGLSETDADGSFLHENWNRDLKLFSTSEDGGQQLLQLLALRAESELPHENLVNNLQLLRSLKAQLGCLFGGNIIRSPTISEGKQSKKSSHEIFRPRSAVNRLTTDIRYKGDWTKRPISSDEVAWLAILLVKFSGWLNEVIGLNSWENGHVGGPTTTWSYVEVPGDTSVNVYGPKDSLRLVCFWLITLGKEAVKLMRKHGMRVNLRMMASKKVVTVLLIAIAFIALKRMFSYFCGV